MSEFPDLFGMGKSAPDPRPLLHHIKTATQLQAALAAYAFFDSSGDTESPAQEKLARVIQRLTTRLIKEATL